MKSVLKLTAPEKAFWKIIDQAQTEPLTGTDILLASCMARDLALVEELAIDGTDDALLAEAVQRINEGARLLKLTPDFPGDTRQHKVARMIFEGPDG